MTRFTGRSGRGGKRRAAIAVLSAVAVLGGVGVSAIPSGAAVGDFVGSSLAGSNFQIDTGANLKIDPGSTISTIDWLKADGSWVSTDPVVVTTDRDTGSGDDSFGQGTKEDTEVPSVVSGAIPPNKSDLKNFGLYIEGDRYLNLFWTRVQDPQGTTNMDFEFNRLNTIPDVQHGGNGVTVPRSDGDFLITYDLSKGGTVPTISVRTWLSTNKWSGATVISSITTGGTAIGSINRDNVIPTSESGGLNELSKNTFGEASIDLELAFPDATCTEIGSAFLKSRSSDSFTAAVKDYIAPRTDVGFSNCPAAEPQTTHRVFLSDEARLGSTGYPGTVTFELYFKPEGDISSTSPCDAGYAVTTPTAVTALWVDLAVNEAGFVAIPSGGLYEATADGVYNWIAKYEAGVGSGQTNGDSHCGSEDTKVDRNP
jgi:hypothetical protein